MRAQPGHVAGALEVNQFETQEFVKADGASDVRYMEHRGGISGFHGHSGEIVLPHVCLAQEGVAPSDCAAPGFRFHDSLLLSCSS